MSWIALGTVVLLAVSPMCMTCVYLLLKGVCLRSMHRNTSENGSMLK